MSCRVLKEFITAFLPLAPVALGEAALVAFFTSLAVFLVSQSTVFYLGKNLCWSVIEVSFARQWCADSFVDELNHFDISFVGVV